MRPLDTERTLRKLRLISNDSNIQFEADSARSHGGHISLSFRDTNDDESIKFIISGDADISPGVQRRMLSFVRDAMSTKPLAKRVYEILVEIFETSDISGGSVQISGSGNIINLGESIGVTPVESWPPPGDAKK